MRAVITLFLATLCLSCNDRSSEQRPVTVPAATAPAPIAGRDTLVIDTLSAICYEPDSLQLAQAKQADSETFYVIADDNVWYTSEAQQFLDSVGIPVIHARNEHVFKFVRSNGYFTYVKKDTIPSLWGTYFFDGIHDPYQADITDIAAEYATYFK